MPMATKLGGLGIQNEELRKVTRSFDHAVLQCHEKNLKHISSRAMPLATKYGSVVTYSKDLSN